jgi:hypothetical protein
MSLTEHLGRTRYFGWKWCAINVTLIRRMVFAKVISAAVLASLLIAGEAIAQASPEGEVLAANKAAMAGLPPAGTLQESYSFSGLGLEGSADRTIDLATGMYVESMQGGPVSVGSGYDGEMPWMRDFSGAFTAEQGGDRPQLAVSQAFRYANVWWQPNFGGANITFIGRETDGKAPVDHLTVTPNGGSTFDAWFDADSHLLTRISEIQGFLRTQTFYSDYQPVEGMMLPRTIVMDPGAGPPSYETLKLKQAVASPARLPAAYARPTTPPLGGVIANGAASATVTFRLLNNHIYVDALVNGKGPSTFIVDTGGHTILSPRLAASLGSGVDGSIPTSGVGDKMSTSGFTPVAEIAIGDVKLQHQTAFVMEVYATAIEGIPVDGMVGFELFRRFAVRIDYQRRTLTFTDPARFDPHEAGDMVPFKFYDHLPDVEGFIDEHPARFDIDTGSRSEVDLTAPFVTRSAIKEAYPSRVEALTGFGVGGAVNSEVIRLSSVTLGSVRIDQPVAELSDAAHGSFSDANYDGNIGSALLKRFTVTFDYAHQRMYLQRIVPAPADVGTFDESGLWFNAGAGGYVVAGVDQGGPGEKAGVVVGDVIEAIDGTPVQPAELSAVRERLRTQPSGTSVHLDLLHGAARRQVVLVLQDLVRPPGHAPQK